MTIFFGSGPGWVEADDAGGVHHFISEIAILVLSIFESNRKKMLQDLIFYLELSAKS